MIAYKKPVTKGWTRHENRQLDYGSGHVYSNSKHRIIAVITVCELQHESGGIKCHVASILKDDGTQCKDGDVRLFAGAFGFKNAKEADLSSVCHATRFIIEPVKMGVLVA